MMEAQGLMVATNTLYNLCFFVHCYLEDIAQEIKRELLEAGLCIHMDETPWPIGKNLKVMVYVGHESSRGKFLSV